MRVLRPCRLRKSFVLAFCPYLKLHRLALIWHSLPDPPGPCPIVKDRLTACLAQMRARVARALVPGSILTLSNQLLDLHVAYGLCSR